VALQKVADVLREADAVRGLIRDSMATLLSLQIELANRRDILATIRGNIDKAREESGRQLFVLDSRPLWEAIFVSQTPDVVMFQIIQSSGKLGDDLREFRTNYSNRILWHAGIFVGFVLLFRYLRRNSTVQAIEPIGASTLFLLERGWSTAFLLGLISVPLFYPAAPAAVFRMAVLPTIVPIIRLLPRLLPEIYRRGVYWLVAIYLLNFVRYMLPAEWLVTRLLLLLIASGGCLGLALFLRARGKELSALGSRERLMILALRLVCVLFAISVFSNCVGNVTLAEILLDVPVRSAYTAAWIFASAYLLTTLVEIALQSNLAQWLRSVRAHGALIALRCRKLIQFCAILFWASVSLSMIGVLGDTFDAASSFLRLRWKVGAAEISIQDLATFFAVFISAAIFSRMLRFVLTEEIFPRIRLPRGAPGAVDVLCRYGVLLLGFLIALAAAGVDFSKVTLLISALGVGIGFGLQNLVNNFVSGLILVFEHPIQVGDHVEVGSLLGQVRKIGFRASILCTPDGADVIVPNSELVGSRVINWSLTDQLRRVSIPVSVAYGTNPDKVRDVLVGIARQHPAILASPAPIVVFDRFADSALNFTLFCWTSVETWFLTRSELTIAINNAFKESGIQIPFPQQDVHIHWVGSADTKDNAKPASEPAGDKSAEIATFSAGGIAQVRK
jgi:small-conductance mechanosensitive channel